MLSWQPHVRMSKFAGTVIVSHQRLRLSPTETAHPSHLATASQLALYIQPPCIREKFLLYIPLQAQSPSSIKTHPFPSHSKSNSTLFHSHTLRQPKFASQKRMPDSTTFFYITVISIIATFLLGIFVKEPSAIANSREATELARAAFEEEQRISREEARAAAAAAADSRRRRREQGEEAAQTP